MLTHDYADVNDIRLHYVSAGQGELLLFVHGFPEFWYEWKNQLTEFGRDYHAVALDMRGYNLSDKPADVNQYKMKHLVADLRALAQYLGHDTFTLIAHDWGGAVAWAFAISHPELLEKLIIINSPHPAIYIRLMRESPAQQKAARYRLNFERDNAEQVLSAKNYAALVDLVLKDGLEYGYFTEEDRRAYIEAWSQPGALKGGLNFYRAMPVGPRRNRNGHVAKRSPMNPAAFMVNVPTLVIWGEQDTFFVSSCLDGLDQFVPDLTIKRVPDGSHWVVHEKPEVVNTAIRDFIANT